MGFDHGWRRVSVRSMTQKSQFGPAVRTLRRMAGMSQAALSQRAGIDRGTLIRIERGDAAPRMDTVEAIARALNTTPSRLMAA